MFYLHLFFSMFNSSFSNVSNINLCLSFVELKTWCLALGWTKLADVSYLYKTKAYDLTRPSIIVFNKMCSNAVLRNVSIFLTIVTTLSSVVVPIVVMSMAFGLY